MLLLVVQRHTLQNKQHTMEIFFIVAGLVMVYSMIHFAVIQFMKKWTERNAYEQIVTIFALVSILMLVISAASE